MRMQLMQQQRQQQNHQQQNMVAVGGGNYQQIPVQNQFNANQNVVAGTQQQHVIHPSMGPSIRPMVSSQSSEVPMSGTDAMVKLNLVLSQNNSLFS